MLGRSSRNTRTTSCGSRSGSPRQMTRPTKTAESASGPARPRASLQTTRFLRFPPNCDVKTGQADWERRTASPEPPRADQSARRGRFDWSGASTAPHQPDGVRPRSAASGSHRPRRPARGRLKGSRASPFGHRQGQLDAEPQWPSPYSSRVEQLPGNRQELPHCHCNELREF
jgi:hypothetical protein